MIVVLFLVFNTVHASYRCVNQCVFNLTSGECTGNNCNPTFINGCPYGCELNGTVCDNIIDISPSRIVLTPFDDGNCQNSNNCSCKCTYNQATNSCQPLMLQLFCQSHYESYCPCQTLTGCYPFMACDANTWCPCSNVNNACIKKVSGPCQAVTCGKFCHSQVCQTDYYQYCQYWQQTVCNNLCSLSYSAPGGCASNNDDQRTICYNTIRATCPNGYIFNQDIPQCNDGNVDSICRQSSSVIQYPEYLEDIGDELKCNYFIDLPCNLMNITITGCPATCNLDTLRNKCVPTYKNTLCGSLNLEMSFNSTCQPEEMLVNDFCGPLWYYDNDQSNLLNNANYYSPILLFYLLIFIF